MAKLLKREWAGRFVRMKRRIEAKSGKIFGAGAVMKVLRNYGGLELTAPTVCPSCGLGDRHFITKVPESDVVLLDDDFEPPMSRPEVVTLCGSSRFVGEMAVLAWSLEKDGKIVHTLHLLPAWYTDQHDHQAEHEGVAEAMDALHLEKIRRSDRVLVVNIGGYIGESTAKEIQFSHSIGKPVAFVERVDI